MTDTLLLKIPEAAARLGVSRRTLDRMLEAGKLRAIRPTGGHRWIVAADLDAYLNRGHRKPPVASNVASSAPEMPEGIVALPVSTRPNQTNIERGMLQSMRQRQANVLKRRNGAGL